MSIFFINTYACSSSMYKVSSTNLIICMLQKRQISGPKTTKKKPILIDVFVFFVYITYEHIC